MGFENRKWVIITLASYTDEELENYFDTADPREQEYILNMLKERGSE